MPECTYYEGGLKSSYVELVLMFQHNLSCGPHTSSIAVEALAWIPEVWSSYPDLRKNPQLQIHHIIGPILLPSQVLCFSCWGTENSQRVQIRRIWRVINQFKATLVTHISNCNYRLVWQDVRTLSHLQGSSYSSWNQLPTSAQLIKLEHHALM